MSGGYGASNVKYLLTLRMQIKQQTSDFCVLAQIATCKGMWAMRRDARRHGGQEPLFQLLAGEVKYLLDH
jgi:hypothetical protein